jgi:hypothetical protein
MSNGKSSLDQLTLFAEEPPANLSASPDCELEWLTRAGISPLHSFPSAIEFGRNGLCGKTSQGFCLVTEGGILAPSSGRWANSATGSPTAFLTRNISESPSVAAVFSLSQTLEIGDVPPRFYLSPKACAGILRRAERRGKALPPALAEALTQSARP